MNSRCSLGAIVFQLKRQTPCRRELRKEGQEKSLWWRNRGQWAWPQEVWARINLPCRILVYHTALGIKGWVGTLCSWELRDPCGTESKTQRRVLKSGKEMIIRFQVPRDRGERWISVQVTRNGCVKFRINLRRLSWTTTISRSPILDILKKSSRMFEKVESSRRRPDSDQKVNVLICGSIMLTTMKAAIHIGEDYNENLVSCRDTKLWGAQNDVRHHAEIDLEAEARDQARLHYWMATFSWEEIYFATWPCNQVVISESTCLFRLSSIFGKDARTSRGHGEVERATSTFAGVQWIQRSLEPTVNHLSSDGIFSQDTQHCTFSKIQARMTFRETRPEEFEDRITFMYMFNDIGPRKGITMNAFRILKSLEISQKKCPLGQWSFLCLGDGEEEKGMERTITNLKDNEILLHMSWLPISKTVNIHFWELPVRWIGDSWKRKVWNARFTSLRILRTQIFHFAQSTLQISSASTEQSRIGVMN